MLYYQLVFLVTCVNFGLGKTALTWSLEYPSESSDHEMYDSISTRRVLRGLADESRLTTKPLEKLQDGSETRHIVLLPEKDNPYSSKFNDVNWPFQWYMHDQRTVLGPVMDHNVVPVYEAGYTGKGVIVGVIGDGVKRGLPDLPEVLDADSNDRTFKMVQEEPSKGKMSPEGTMMAAVIGMKANNAKCGVGVAYDASIVSIKVTSEKSSNVDDYVFAHAITYDKFKDLEVSGKLCDIYAFAIGRPDDGMFMPNQLSKFEVERAFTRGITEGRNHRGSVYVIGAGYGKTSAEDNCGADDLVNDPATIVIASADHRGRVTPYSERCSAVMATAYSSGDNQAIVTSDVDGSCSKEYSGNNPSVAIAAGIFALALKANKELTARDIQHLVAFTSEVAPLVVNKGTWKKNAAGFYFSNDFGFGLLNAENMVTAATNNWARSFPELKASLQFEFSNSGLAVGKPTTGTVSHHSIITYVELVEIGCTVYLKFRGSITISLRSPSGTEVVLLETRPRDRAKSGLENWRFKTGHFWGESPAGVWTLIASIVQFSEDQTPQQPSCMSSLVNSIRNSIGLFNKIEWATIKIHGTEAKPKQYNMRNAFNKARRTYSAFNSEELSSRDDQNPTGFLAL